MCRYLGLWLGLLLRCVQSRRSLLLENLALRQQLAVLKRKHPGPRIGAVDKIFWLLARRFWSTLEAVPRAGQSGDSRPLASGRVSPVLEFDLQGETASGKEEAV
jgi:hypothetical protein